MYGKVMIGQHEVEMVSNAATPYRYTQIFKDDFMSEITTDLTDAKATNVFMRLGYVMACQAEKKDMTKCTEDTWAAWLEQFEFQDMVNALADISAIYAGTAKTTAVPK